MSSLISKIYTLSAPYHLALKEVEINQNIGDDEIITKTIYTALSPGTEVSAYIGLTPLRPGNIYPRVVGYCNISKVLKKGDNVLGVKEGDYLLTFQSHRDFIKLKRNDFYLKIEPKGSVKFFATSYLYHLGYHSLLTADVKQGHNVGVIGAGVLGYTTAIMSEVAGANTFIFSNQNEVAEKFADNHIHVFPKQDTAFETIDQLTYGTGLDIIINTSNTWDDWLLALKAIRKGGLILNLGFPGRGQQIPDFNPLDPQYVYMKNLTIKALNVINENDVPPYEDRFNMKRNLEYIIGLIEKGILKPTDLITDEVSYTELENQYKKYASRDQYMLTSILKW
jgi:threonine dehydrogenase-like Zn-dependent dehydrogenase